MGVTPIVRLIGLMVTNHYFVDLGLKDRVLVVQHVRLASVKILIYLLICIKPTLNFMFGRSAADLAVAVYMIRASGLL